MWLFVSLIEGEKYILWPFGLGFEHVTCFSQLNEVNVSGYLFSTHSLSLAPIIAMRGKSLALPLVSTDVRHVEQS